MDKDIQNNDNQVEKKTTESVNDNSAVVNQDEKKNDDHMIPKPRFDEINSKYKKLQEKVSAFELAEEEREMNQLKETGELKAFSEKVMAENKELKAFKEMKDAEEEQERIETLAKMPAEVQEKLKDHPHDVVKTVYGLYSQQTNSPKVNTANPVRDKLGVESADEFWNKSDDFKRKNWKDYLKIISK
tara:strand:- start:3244 stop:3804 length:561 start_codon:yes stop_codon:yes gene_type:complete